MTREEKVKKRKERAKRRKEKRNEAYRILIQKAFLFGRVPYYGFRNRWDEPWKDLDSPTGWRQNCSWQGTCQYPCNGDC